MGYDFSLHVISYQNGHPFTRLNRRCIGRLRHPLFVCASAFSLSHGEIGSKVLELRQVDQSS
jgi:hypothetical protein